MEVTIEPLTDGLMLLRKIIMQFVHNTTPIVKIFEKRRIFYHPVLQSIFLSKFTERRGDEKVLAVTHFVLERYFLFPLCPVSRRFNI